MADSSDISQDTTQRRSFLSRYRWLFFLILGVVLLPSLLTVTGRQRSVLNFVHPKLSKAVTFKSATTHWWAPVELNDVRVTDLAMEPVEGVDPVPLMTATSISTTQPLWQLLLSMGKRAEVTVLQPVVNIRVRDGQTNIEHAMTSIFGASEVATSSPTTPVSVTIQDGIVRLLSESPAGTHPSPLFTTISNINGTLSTLDQSKLIPNVSLVADIGAPVSVGPSTDIAEASRQPGVNPRIAATLDELAGDFPRMPFNDTDLAVLKSDETQPSLKVQIAAAADRPDVQNLIIEARQLKLAELEPLVQRVLPGTVCVGEVSCLLQAHLLESGNDDGFAGRLQLLAENVRWRNTAWATGESVDLESVSAQGAVAMAKDGLMINDLRIRSALLDLAGNGEVKTTLAAPLPGVLAEGEPEPATNTAANSGEVNLTGRVDFARLTKMLPRTLNIAEGVTADKGELRFSFRVQQHEATPASPGDVFAPRTPEFGWRLAAETSPIVARRNGQPLTMNSSLRIDAIGDLSPTTATMTRGRIAGEFGQITADPVDNGFAVSGTVNPDRLWQDVRQLIDIPRPGLSGDVTVNGEVRFSDVATQLAAFKLSSQELEIESPSLAIHSAAPIMQMFDGTVTINGTAAALKTVIAPWHDATWLASGSTVIARLAADPQQDILLQAVIQKPSGSRSSQSDTFFVIDQGRLDANIVADSQTGFYRIDRGNVEIPGVKAAISGSLGMDSGLLVMNLDADTQYDLDQLTSVLLNDPNRTIQLTGIRQDVFHLEGSPSLWTEADLSRHVARTPNFEGGTLLHPLKASGCVSWDGGRLYGLALGEGMAVAQLHNGLLRTEPISCTLGTGSINVMPQWDMNSNLVQLAPGSRIQDLQVTPELSSEWLGYLTPMMSDAASVQGTVTARVQQFDYFLDSPSTSTIHGQLSLTNAVASAGQSLGPLMQVLDLVDRDNGTQAGGTRQLQFPNQDIPFELRNGMVLHDGLQVQFGNYRISSSGGVGLNKRVQLVLTVPLEKNVADAGSARTLQIPVGGTVDRPQLDTRGLLQNLGRQQIQNQVDKQLDRGLNKLLDKFR